jgi:hypothetical protein
MLAAADPGIIRDFYLSWILWLLGLVALAACLLGSTFLAVPLIVAALAIYALLAASALRFRRSVEGRLAVRRKINGKAMQPRSTTLRRLAPALLAPLSPSEMRIVAMDQALFNGALSAAVDRPPRLCLSSVDLLSGRQKIWSRGVLAELSDAGADALWRNRPEDWPEADHWDIPAGEPVFRAAYDVSEVPLVRAVAASTAIPPIFGPVKLVLDGRIVGVFSDGGVLDNLSINPILQFAHSISASRRLRYDVAAGGESQFRDVVGRVLIADAGARAGRRHRQFLLRSAVLRRLLDVMLQHQDVESYRKKELLQSFIGRPVDMVGLIRGFPPGTRFADDKRWLAVGRIRTHLDRFSDAEKAALAYSGYCWAMYWGSGAVGTLQSFEEVVADMGLRCESADAALRDIELRSSRSGAILRFAEALFRTPAARTK